MVKLHLCYHELSEQTQNELKKIVEDNYKITHKPLHLFNEELTELFNRNNAGIDLDLFPFML